MTTPSREIEHFVTDSTLIHLHRHLFLHTTQMDPIFGVLLKSDLPYHSKVTQLDDILRFQLLIFMYDFDKNRLSIGLSWFSERIENVHNQTLSARGKNIHKDSMHLYGLSSSFTFKYISSSSALVRTVSGELWCSAKVGHSHFGRGTKIL